MLVCLWICGYIITTCVANTLTDNIILITSTARHRISSTGHWLFTVDVSLDEGFEIVSSVLSFRSS